MKLTKDEARILFMALQDFNSAFYIKDLPDLRRSEIWNKLQELSARLNKQSKDNRRIGRKSQDSFTDCLKRYAA